MVMVINKRVIRVLLENKAQYISSVLLVVLSCFLFTGLVLVSGNLTRLMNDYEKAYLQEDASFTSDKSVGNLPELESASDAIIEESKSSDYALSDGVTLRIFTRNDKINLPAVVEGKDLSGNGGILISPAFADAHGYKTGDVLTIANRKFTVVGFMMLPNYIYPLKSETDIMYSPQNFGIAVVSKEDFATLGKGSSSYAVKFNHPAQNTRARSMQFIELLKSRGIGITQWTGIGVNSRVSGAVAKFNSAGLMGTALPIAFFLLTAVLLGNVIGRMIKRESAIVGALYALGYRKKELYRHYLKFPLVIAVIGGILGNILGLLTVRPLLSVYFTQFEIPNTGIDYNPAVILLGLLLPAVFLGLSGWIVVRKQLKHSPVELMKGDQEKSGINFLERRFQLEKLKFALKFKIREQFRSLSRLVLLLTGCAVATLLLLFGFFLKSGMDYFLENEVKNAQNYRYEYVFDDLRTGRTPEGAEPFAASKFLLPGNGDKVFNVAGCLPDSKISTVTDESGNGLRIDRVIITRPVADKLGAKPGDTITIVRKSDYQEFSLTVGSISPSYNMTILMPLREYNEKFGMPEGSYNELFSNKILGIPKGEPYKMYSIEDKISAIQGVMAPLTSMVGLIAAIAFLMGIMIIYLVTSMIVEENKGAISLMRIFGYRRKEVNSLILNSSTVFVVVGYLLGILLSFASVRGLLKALENNLTFAMPVTIEPLYVIIGFVVVMLSYELSKLLCRRKVHAVPMSEALKAGAE